MDNRESPFVRTQASRSMIRPQGTRKLLMPSPTERARQLMSGRQSSSPTPPPPPPPPEAVSPLVPKRLSAPHMPMESLKQWELVENDKGLQVVEKRIGGSLSPVRPKETTAPGSFYSSTPVTGRRHVGEKCLEEKLKVFNDSKIIQPTVRLQLGGQQQREPSPTMTVEPKAPLSLDLILKQRTGGTVESTDMLQRLEQQVKAIEMGTLAARTRQLENSADFGPEVQLRYREHEDLLRNVTDDEAEG